MKKYQHNQKCPKCGQEKIINKFIERGDSYYVHNYYSGYRDTANEDIIHRCCCNCHYEWNEEPLENNDK